MCGSREERSARLRGCTGGRWAPAGGLAILVMAAAGCGSKSDGPLLLSVRGTVLFEGSPVESGRIVFRRTDGDQKAYAAEISRGSYALQSEPGPMKVEIIASRPIPGKFDHSNGVPEPIGEMYIPKQYNAQTTLTADVTPSSTNTFDFDLNAK